jgi:hypothetical protein|tara:strand:+ start:505 stop:657 length:153 start_codon:yes stop_codon:yes gene_type:complete
MIYLFLVCVHIGQGLTIIDMDEGFYTYEQCMESIKTIGDEVYCVSKYIEI